MKKVICIIAAVLLIIGGLNWGLVGLFNFDLVAELFGYFSVISRVIYILVGLSAVYAIVMWVVKRGRCCSCGKADCKVCNPAKK